MAAVPPGTARRPVPDHAFGGRLRGAYLLDLEVTAVDDVASHVRSVTVASTDLIGFEHAAGQDLMIEFPLSGGTVRRRYTLRRSDPAAGTAVLEMERHEGLGPAVTWLAGARPGLRLQAIGPRGSIRLRPEAASHWFVVDDSAMPAAFAMLEALPPGADAIAFLVTPHGCGSRPTPELAKGKALRWVDPAELPAVLSMASVPAGGAVQLLGERTMVRDARAILQEIGVPSEAIVTKAYWRRDQANAPHGEPAPA